MSVHAVLSEIAGVVFELLVKPGDVVEEGQTLMLLESMKMEIPVLAPNAGVVESLLVDEGGPVAEGQAVAKIRGE